MTSPGFTADDKPLARLLGGSKLSATTVTETAGAFQERITEDGDGLRITEDGNASRGTQVFIAGGETFAGEVTFDGAASVTVDGRRSRPAAVPFLSTGELAATASLIGAGRVRYEGVGGFSALGNRTTPGAVTYIAGGMELQADGRRWRPGATDLTGAATLDAFAAFLRDGEVTFTGTGALTARGSALIVSSARFDGTATLDTQTIAEFQTSVRMSGASTFTAPGSRITVGVAEFTGGAILDALGTGGTRGNAYVRYDGDWRRSTPYVNVSETAVRATEDGKERVSEFGLRRGIVKIDPDIPLWEPAVAAFVKVDGEWRQFFKE